MANVYYDLNGFVLLNGGGNAEENESLIAAVEMEKGLHPSVSIYGFEDRTDQVVVRVPYRLRDMFQVKYDLELNAEHQLKARDDFLLWKCITDEEFIAQAEEERRNSDDILESPSIGMPTQDFITRFGPKGTQRTINYWRKSKGNQNRIAYTKVRQLTDKSIAFRVMANKEYFDEVHEFFINAVRLFMQYGNPSK